VKTKLHAPDDARFQGGKCKSQHVACRARRRLRNGSVPIARRPFSTVLSDRVPAAECCKIWTALFLFFIDLFLTLKRRLAAFAALFAYSSSVKGSLNLICGRASGFSGTWLRLIRSTTKVQ
jgi:hypothetical protein